MMPRAGLSVLGDKKIVVHQQTAPVQNSADPGIGFLLPRAIILVVPFCAGFLIPLVPARKLLYGAQKTVTGTFSCRRTCLIGISSNGPSEIALS